MVTFTFRICPNSKNLPSLSKPHATQQLVTFIVDREEVKQTFIVHLAVAAFYSPFFKAAFESRFIEGQTHTMRLEDVDGQVFGLLVHWLYLQQIEGCENTTAANLMPYTRLWILGDRFLIPNLQKQLLGLIERLLDAEKGPNLKDFLQCVYERQVRDCPLKRLAVDKMSLGITFKSFQEWSGELPPSMWLEVALKCKEYGPSHYQPRMQIDLDKPNTKPT